MKFPIFMENQRIAVTDALICQYEAGYLKREGLEGKKEKKKKVGANALLSVVVRSNCSGTAKVRNDPEILQNLSNAKGWVCSYLGLGLIYPIPIQFKIDSNVMRFEKHRG